MKYFWEMLQKIANHSKWEYSGTVDEIQWQAMAGNGRQWQAMAGNGRHRLELVAMSGNVWLWLSALAAVMPMMSMMPMLCCDGTHLKPESRLDSVYKSR